MPKNHVESEVGIQHKISERGVLGNGSSPEARFVGNQAKLGEYVDALRTLQQRIVLTSGTFDLLHVGHAKYLEVAKSYGDVLIVGVDSDEKVRARKGPDRPVVPEEERINMLAHLRSVDIITIKHPDDERWSLIKSIKPDTLIVTQETYDDETVEELEEICGKVVVLEPQATTSTSAQIRRLQIGFYGKVEKPIEELLEEYDAHPDLRRKIGSILGNRRDE
ncbi:MAG: adenylyltransferase/cytidyltransferase family protein [Candidatus Saccharibacteria bacterium]|nr:adenylyltransferase/cytidyltransferase family protein [Candidatus Saccharibacteria bacterium]